MVSIMASSQSRILRMSSQHVSKARRGRPHRHPRTRSTRPAWSSSWQRQPAA